MGPPPDDFPRRCTSFDGGVIERMNRAAPLGSDPAFNNLNAGSLRLEAAFKDLNTCCSYAPSRSR
jgi:hypothetical protein